MQLDSEVYIELKTCTKRLGLTKITGGETNQFVYLSNKLPTKINKKKKRWKKDYVSYLVHNSARITCCHTSILFLHERKQKHDQKRPIYVCSIHLIPLQLKEVVEIVGVEGRAYVRRCGSLAESEIRVGRVCFGSKGVKSAGLVGVLQGEIDPVK